jgi:hypothetical protein
MTNNDATKFEFLLTLSGNIICQRFFNVKNHNPESRRSLDLHYEVKNICDEISENLKEKTLDYLHENPNYFPVSGSEEGDDQPIEEYFLLEIKYNDSVFISRVFAAHIFHPKVRYSVDIRPYLRRILGSLTDTLSTQSVETEYQGYDLLKN